ncbi:MAG: alpha/beta hydrolase [Mangrovicoccus sp.]|nr:alpha/beta hydrolase [Mangrovicoccus sp.]
MNAAEGKVGDRRYVLIDPSQVQGPAPLILALHGGFGSAKSFQRALPLESSAAQKGFRAVYLEGSGGKARSWNAGECCGPAQKKNVNDLAYIDSVISDLQKKGLVSSVHMIGHSNGAMMIYRYICEGGYKVSSAVIISGSKMNKGCRKAAGTRTLILHGANDRNVPVNGGRGKGVSGVSFNSLDRSAKDLQAAGANVSVMQLPGAEHAMRGIDKSMRANKGQSVPQFAAAFLLGG